MVIIRFYFIFILFYFLFISFYLFILYKINIIITIIYNS